MTKEEYIKSIESVFIDMLKKAVIKAILSKLPWIVSYGLSPVVTLIMGKIIDLAAKEMNMRVFFVYTDLRTNQQANDFSKAALEYDQQRTPENETKMLDAFYKLASLSL